MLKRNDIFCESMTSRLKECVSLTTINTRIPKYCLFLRTQYFMIAKVSSMRQKNKGICESQANFLLLRLSQKGLVKALTEHEENESKSKERVNRKVLTQNLDTVKFISDKKIKKIQFSNQMNVQIRYSTVAFVTPNNFALTFIKES